MHAKAGHMTEFQPMASRGSEVSSLLPFKVTLEDTCSQKQLEGDKELAHPHKATREQWTAGHGVEAGGRA